MNTDINERSESLNTQKDSLCIIQYNGLTVLASQVYTSEDKLVIYLYDVSEDELGGRVYNGNILSASWQLGACFLEMSGDVLMCISFIKDDSEEIQEWKMSGKDKFFSSADEHFKAYL